MTSIMHSTYLIVCCLKFWAMWLDQSQLATLRGEERRWRHQLWTTTQSSGSARRYTTVPSRPLRPSRVQPELTGKLPHLFVCLYGIYITCYYRQRCKYLTLSPLAVNFEFWRPFMTFANNLDPVEAPQNVGLHLRSKLFDIQIINWPKKMGGNNFLKILKETNIWKNYPACKELNCTETAGMIKGVHFFLPRL